MTTRRLLIYVASALILTVTLAAGQRGGPYDARLDERALAQITGRDNTSLANTSACGSASLGQGQVLWNNCPGQSLLSPIQQSSQGPIPAVECIKCSPEATTIVQNTTGGPGITKKNTNAACYNFSMYVGTCSNGVCTGLIQSGKCSGTPPVYMNQN